jgi:hypothetical protein
VIAVGLEPGRDGIAMDGVEFSLRDMSMRRNWNDWNPEVGPIEVRNSAKARIVARIGIVWLTVRHSALTRARK